MLKDLRHALRLLARSPGFTSLCVATLALGIGANTALFSVANSVLWRPLPFEKPDELRMVYVKAPALVAGTFPFSAADVLDLQQNTRVYSTVAAFSSRPFDLSGTGEPFRVDGARVSPTLFPLLGRPPVAGRTFSSEEDDGAHRVAVLSLRLADRLFGGPGAAVGRSVSLDRLPYTVIGVMPSDFRFPLRGLPYVQEAELWVPVSFTKEELAGRGDNYNHSVIVRCKEGVLPEAEAADTRRVLAISKEQYPASFPREAELVPEIVPLARQVSGQAKGSVLLLLGAVGFVLLIACTNVANLMLTRALSRQGELAVRTALGASRGRLSRQLLTESVLLGLSGGVVGLAVAYYGTDLIVKLAADSLPRSEEVSVDARALLFNLVASLGAGILFGLAPALSLGQTDLSRTLNEAGRGTIGGSRGRLGSLLVVGEVALAVVLSTGAGLLVRTLLKLNAADPGFRGKHVLSVSLSLPSTRYANGDDVRSFHQRLSAGLEAQPGFEKLGITTTPPFGESWTKLFSVEGITKPGDRPVLTIHSIVAGDYFATMGIPLLRGRLLGLEDREQAQRTIVVNRAFALQVFGEGDAVGRRIKNGMLDDDSPWATIVGVVGDVKTSRVDQEAQPQTYEFWLQAPGWEWALARVTYVVRTTGEPSAFAPAVRAQVSQVDPEQAVGRIAPMPELVTDSLRRERFRMGLLLAFATTALVLAAVGIAGVTGVVVSQRRHEIGVRMALGARRDRILREVMAGGVRLVLAGLAIGLGGGLVLSRLVSGFLYGVAAWDPATYVAATALLLVTGLAAVYVPARRATRIDPVVALRYE